jgi:hypothetical protein
MIEIVLTFYMLTNFLVESLKNHIRWKKGEESAIRTKSYFLGTLFRYIIYFTFLYLGGFYD